MHHPLIRLRLVRLQQGYFLFIGYLSNNSFPHPLSEADEAKHIKSFKAGSEESRNILIEHNLRLVAHIVKKFESSGEEIDDLISIGTMGLIKAINSFDPNKGTRLATYAARCIENEILMHLRAKKKHRGEVSLYDPIGTDKEGNEICLLDILGTDSDAVAKEVEYYYDKESVRRQIEYLSKREKKVLEMRYGLFNGLRRTQKDIAKKLGISRSYVSRIEKKAIEKLIKELNE